ncbi:hypothetical protein [uncultured Chitinophaga sp.]|jgi:Transcription initiation factor TFIID, subunit TAF12 (also component of histone acetyltransferase SAGA)|uniref:hypothetical protein n=1 Tax=uncultured Chitinophaga sp. TaxID=339340 RepID=UPI00261C0BF7|nr:hypothetical protein [uncultured Chitinophaga sp.]
MKEDRDSHIQRLLDEGNMEAWEHLRQTANAHELEAYQQLYRMLGKNIPQGLPMDFSARVTRQVQLRRQRRENRMLALSMAGAILLCLFGAVVLMLFIDKKYNSQFLLSLTRYKWIIGTCLLFLFLVQYFDHRYLKSKNFEFRKRH